MATDLEIARAATLQPILRIAERAGIPEAAVEPHGRFKAKLDPGRIPDSGRTGALVLVTGINPTAAGEGKTTTTIGLGDALNALGTRTMICLREPSLGPCFGVKGGATGGGRAQVAPMEDINLHFTGDFHAITSANNLLSAMVDNHLHWGNALGLDQRRITWRRAIDMNDRALRDVLVGLGGMPNGLPREDGFDITVASEVMAILCLSNDLADLQARLGRIIVGQRRDGTSVTAAELKAHGAMAALLREAMFPNLVQTLEGSPALVHGGPFANIAHGCNSVAATRLGLRLADVVVTEAGFGADLGGEKFCDIKCRLAGLSPEACVVVATVRALKLNGGVARGELDREDVAAVKRGVVNVVRHVENMRLFGLPVVVALNRFTSDTEAEIAVVREALAPLGAEVVLCTHWADGAAGAMELGRAVRRLIEDGTARFAPIYEDSLPLEEKIRTIARRIYRAADIAVPPSVHSRLKRFEEAGFGQVPVCIAKTQYSFSADPAALGAPTGHVLPVREVRLAAGAGFVVAICGDVMTMPGLPRSPAAERIGLDAEGNIEGLF
ncbi:formate--tetrahydrofolate ligase [Roseomonas sp. OT10]|uniref:formate--tetrahydrofolate ligase n=1 Tax=Roseomonas cutis TaxID=2897332 RepID=UPI001E448D27|nr:formate--tetrahydrofolate ligase [Roseomonas sp. OT10]UFN47481.1 formate--tetrahydrofolate ligase [Roseomonas sp. OT10]